MLHEVERQKANKLYSSKRWRKLRKEVLSDNPMCMCPADCGLEATVVDHIEPHRGDMKLFWDRRNLQALAKRCHDSWKQKLEGGRSYDPLKGTDITGQPLDPDHPWYEER